MPDGGSGEERERDGQGEIGKREKIQTLKEKSRQFEEKKDKKAYYGNRTEKTFELKSSSTRENVRSKIFLPPGPSLSRGNFWEIRSTPSHAQGCLLTWLQLIPPQPPPPPPPPLSSSPDLANRLLLFSFLLPFFFFFKGRIGSIYHILPLPPFRRRHRETRVRSPKKNTILGTQTQCNIPKMLETERWNILSSKKIQIIWKHLEKFVVCLCLKMRENSIPVTNEHLASQRHSPPPLPRGPSVRPDLTLRHQRTHSSVSQKKPPRGGGCVFIQFLTTLPCHHRHRDLTH